MKLLEFKKFLQDEDIIFAYNGNISQRLISDVEGIIFDSIKAHQEQIQSKIIRNIFLIAIEQLQNIKKYSLDRIIKDDENNICESRGICIIGYDKENSRYYINTLNQVSQDDKTKITKKIDEVNSLDDKEQRKRIKELLKSGDLSHSKGAGIGLYEMARKSSDKLEYNFIEDDGKLFFELTAFV
jgi:hypothetical protein